MKEKYRWKKVLLGEAVVSSWDIKEAAYVSSFKLDIGKGRALEGRECVCVNSASPWLLSQIGSRHTSKLRLQEKHLPLPLISSTSAIPLESFAETTAYLYLRSRVAL